MAMPTLRDFCASPEQMQNECELRSPADLRRELSLVDAKLFATTNPAVIEAIDSSADTNEALHRLQELGMSETEADSVLEMPLRARSRGRT